MKLSTVLSTSIVALSLVACGSDNDTAKPDDGKNNLPPKSEECIAAGDRCQLEGDKWVIHEKKDDKEQKDEPPVTDSAFDYSDIGVTDELKAEKRGFSFWHKGNKSPLNAKKFAKNKPTQSPTIQWSSALNYDVDLWNFVAITLDDGDKNEKNKPKYMFDEIGVENQKDNINSYLFGFHKANHSETAGAIYSARSSYDYANKKYVWNVVPALVNTFMYRNKEKGWNVFKDASTNAFLNEEKYKGSLTLYYRDTTANADKDIGKVGTGATKLRVYGVNAFLELPDSSGVVTKDNALKVIDTSTDEPITVSANLNPGTDKKYFYNLSTRTDKTALKHYNFVWYKLSNKGKRTQRTTVKTDGSGLDLAIDKYASDKPFPTDIELDQLHYTQFGRLTGQGIDPDSGKINGYTDELLRKYEFTPESLAAAAGNKEAEDWYFARGTEPTPVSTLENYKTAGNKVVYDGMAVMFGIDYDPRKPVKPTETKNDQSTNSVKPPPGLSNQSTLLDGKQNFVRMTWDPSTGDIKGSVYGVWTQASYWYANTKQGTLPKDNVAKLTIDPQTKKIVADTTKAGVAILKFAKTELKDLLPERAVADTLLKDTSDTTSTALKIEPFITELVHMEGKVVEGTNGFGGKAIRVKDESTGLFHGGFFGRDGSEIGGVINSQTGNFKDENLADPGAKWGGAFGAKNQKSEVEEDLIFSDKPVDYGTSTEFFTTN